jgi:hypothetical protein
MRLGRRHEQIEIINEMKSGNGRVQRGIYRCLYSSTREILKLCCPHPSESRCYFIWNVCGRDWSLNSDTFKRIMLGFASRNVADCSFHRDKSVDIHVRVFCRSKRLQRAPSQNVFLTNMRFTVVISGLPKGLKDRASNHCSAVRVMDAITTRPKGHHNQS